MVIGGVPVESGQQIVQVGGGELPLERLCRGVVAVFEGSEPVPDLGEVKSFGETTLRCTTEKKISTWFNQEACTGVCTSTAFGKAAASRSAAFLPRWEEPLSTTQNTRFALAYGSWVMTWVTRFMNGSMPVRGSVRPNTLAAWTS